MIAPFTKRIHHYLLPDGYQDPPTPPHKTPVAVWWLDNYQDITWPGNLLSYIEKHGPELTDEAKEILTKPRPEQE